MKRIIWILVIAALAGAAAFSLMRYTPIEPVAPIEPSPDLPKQLTKPVETQKPQREPAIKPKPVIPESKPVENGALEEPAVELFPVALKNYSYAFWLNGWKKNLNDKSADILSFETGHYGLTLDLSDFGKTRFSLLNDKADYTEALREDTKRISGLDPVELVIKVNVDGRIFRAVTCQAGIDQGVKKLQAARLWESGQLVQHYDLIGLVFKDDSGLELSCEGKLDIVVWPNSLALNLELAPEQSGWSNAKIGMQFNDWHTEKTISGAWETGAKKQFRIACDLNGREKVKNGIAIQLNTPQNQNFPVEFDDVYNCYFAKISKRDLKRRWKTGYTDIREYDEFDISIENSNGNTYVPFQLDLSNPGNITGLCPILCLKDGTPTGIPVQLSKNWHHEGLGAYLRAYALIPAKQGASNYKLRIAYGFYGTLPSASHAQLSLIGWGKDGAHGNNGRWDQLAIGCWGETICFDMDMSCVENVITDVRLLMTRNGRTGGKWTWTDAGWGGDWMNLRDNHDQKLYFTELKTAYVSQGPCLTEVHYDGYYGSEREVDLKATVRTLRTDDYARTFLSFNYTFTKPVSATDGWLFKMGKTSRLVTPEVAYGNIDGLIKEHKVPSRLDKGEVYLKQTELTGNGPWWVAFPGAYKVDGKDWGTGSRALVIRSYEALLDGKTYTNPTISFPVYRVESRGNINLDMILTPPKGVKEFQPGDTVAFEAEWITLPRIADDYYGPNEIFRKHLAKYPRSWKSVYREALGNNLKVQTVGGTVKQSYPIIIEATRSDDIQVKIAGGVGVVPIRFEGLESANYALYQVVGSKRSKLDQSVHGNDFWQTRYDPKSNTYSLTFNLPLDGLRTSGWILRAD
ncbi:hypothetical protein [Pontiella sulfatireligans]|nr:hypothetical protein [Pontiella sulfatireligans]